ncbi:hypothetical protein WJX84_009906 [Apatococcus fuscideae]|uniref:Uncharacterized protein n=1 Tax=Apatococcus fuscideae TaxID=2026836 RepID=A0AAW1RZS2_9CHLO
MAQAAACGRPRPLVISFSHYLPFQAQGAYVWPAGRV